jgi:hypothetical protein
MPDILTNVHNGTCATDLHVSVQGFSPFCQLVWLVWNTWKMLKLFSFSLMLCKIYRGFEPTEHIPPNGHGKLRKNEYNLHRYALEALEKMTCCLSFFVIHSVSYPLLLAHNCLCRLLQLNTIWELIIICQVYTQEQINNYLIWSISISRTISIIHQSQSSLNYYIPRWSQ